jgi:hypothetical protein
MNSSFPQPLPGLVRPPDKVRIFIPGLYHGPLTLTGIPRAEDVTYDNDVPVGRLLLGEVAGRPVTIECTDVSYLAGLRAELDIAQRRLSLWRAAA